jgi:hypothetical protein
MSFLYIGRTPEDAKEARKLLRKRGLISYMNDTKWRELCTAIETLPFPPPYQTKYLLGIEPVLWEPGYIPPFWGDWAKTPEAAFGIFIEWVRITPRYSKHGGRLIEPEIFDCSVEFASLLKSLSIPFIEEDGIVTIYGHAKSGQPVSA